MKWRKGPPPSIGWWPASYCRGANVLRWWNGAWWSLAAYSKMTAEQAAEQATVKSDFHDAVEWTDRPAWWPERSKT
jgi:hypothetical protein